MKYILRVTLKFNNIGKITGFIYGMIRRKFIDFDDSAQVSGFSLEFPVGRKGFDRDRGWFLINDLADEFPGGRTKAPTHHRMAGSQ